MLNFLFRNEILFIFFAAFFSALSGFLLKTGAEKLNGGSFFSFDVIFPYLVALLSYALGFVAYSLALRSTNVSQAYPSMIGVTMLLIFAWNMFSGFEEINMRGIMGALLVLSGVCLMSSSVSD